MNDIVLAFGVRINAITAKSLFDRYQQLGFLYPNKLQALAPYMDLVLGNWQKAITGDPDLFRVLTYEHENAWASITSWQTTIGGVHSQHLVSTGKSHASCAVMLAEQSIGLQNTCLRSGQNWFQPSNRYASRVFATAAKTIGEQSATVEPYAYIAVPFRTRGPMSSGIGILSGMNRHRDIFRLAQRTRGTVYAQAEEFDQPDVGLEALDQRYRKIGLYRYRRVWLATLPRFQEPVGAIVAYRGPLGFNFSFLENRCDLLIQDGLTLEEEHNVLFQLLQAAAPVYQDFSPGFIPVVVDQARAPFLIDGGGTLIRNYAQSIWLRPGFQKWYDHVEALYRRVKASNHTQGVRRKSAAEVTHA